MLPSLHSYLADALPSTVRLLVHHVVSGKYVSPALFSAPPGELPEPTTAESHLLSVSIKYNGRALQVFALEIYVYETASLTTIFVSKADSTGYLHLLALPVGTPSPIKAIITAFLDWLITTKRRNNTRLLLSLFARAQNQYLFPGSIENSGKHVLDDRQLIRWWCRVLNPILLKYSKPDGQQVDQIQAHAHLIVPGLDSYETRSYFPKGVSAELGEKTRWSASDPLQNLGKQNGLPPRCYIPRFPDDPKARFVIDLDDELPNEPEEETQLEKGKSPGVWKSVKSLTQFWELMSFRQECSAGRLVGFIWLVLEASEIAGRAQETGDRDTSTANISHSSSDTQKAQVPQVIHSSVSDTTESTLSPTLRAPQDQMVHPATPIVPQPKDALVSQSKEDFEKVTPLLPEPAEPERQDPSSSLQINKVVYENLLLELDHLDYADLDIALDSTEKFLGTLSKLNDLNQDWGREVIGKNTQISQPSTTPTQTTMGSKDGDGATVNVISTLSVKRKKQSVDETPAASIAAKVPIVNVLSSTTVRKKPKV